MSLESGSVDVGVNECPVHFQSSLSMFPPFDGRYTLAECYALSVPFRSWRMVLVGDPLYRPFR